MDATINTRDISLIIGDCFDCFRQLENLRTVTAFLPARNDAKRRIRITRTRKNDEGFVVTIGEPNYAEREFLKLCRKAKTHPKKFWFKYFKQ